MTRVLAFSCSHHQPSLLRHSTLQMLMQTWPRLDYSVYIHTDLPDLPAAGDYTSLLSDLQSLRGRRLFIGYGRSLHPHLNYFQAIRQTNWEKDYDLFLKVDNDDVYRLNYVEEVVRDFERHGRDFSGEGSYSIIDDIRWQPEKIVHDPEINKEGKCSGLPSTWAFSPAAIRAISHCDGSSPLSEDVLWKRHIEGNADLRLHCRHTTPPVYHKHIYDRHKTARRRYAKDAVAKPNDYASAGVMQLCRVAVCLLQQALPLLPGDIMRYCFCRLLHTAPTDKETDQETRP